MSTANSIASFVEALKHSGIVISDETRLIERLNKAGDAPEAVEIVFNKVISNSKASGVSFYGDTAKTSAGVTKAFKDINFDGFTWRSFQQCVKPL
jgi:hypothetical protein